MAMAPPVALLALLALLPAVPAGALAQGDGNVTLAEVAEELRRIGDEIRVTEGETAWLYAASLAVGVSIAVIAFLATRANTSRLAEQSRLFRERLDLLKEDMENRLRPVLAWCLFEDGSLIKVSGSGARPSGLTIRVINTGQVSAEDVVVYLDARIVGGGAPPAPKMLRLGALGPGRSVEIHANLSPEDLGSAMGGGIAYVEAAFTYRDGGGNMLEYGVAGYRSSTVSTLFGVKGVVPHGGGGRGLAPPPAGVPAGHKGDPGHSASAMSRRIQSVGLHARALAMQESRSDMAKEEAERLLSECEDMAKKDPQDATAHRKMAAALCALGRHGDALQAARRAEKAYGADARTLKEMARILSGLGRHGEAIGILNRALAWGNNDLCLHREKARRHVLLGEYAAAYGVWPSIIGQDPRYETHMGMASLCMVLLQYRDAIDELGSAIDSRPDDEYAHVQKGIAQLCYGHDQAAEATLRRAVELNGGLADARVNLAHALYRLGREAEAAEELDLAVVADPGNQKAHVDRGVLMLEMGHHERAQESFEAARRLDPSMRVPQAGGASRPDGAARRGRPGKA